MTYEEMRQHNCEFIARFGQRQRFALRVIWLGLTLSVLIVLGAFARLGYLQYQGEPVPGVAWWLAALMGCLTIPWYIVVLILAAARKRRAGR